MSEVLLEEIAAVTGVKPYLILRILDDWHKELVK